MAADHSVLDVVITVTWVEPVEPVYPTPAEVFLQMAGEARTVIEHYSHRYNLLSGNLASFYHAVPREWDEYLAALDTYNMLVAS